MKVKYIDRGIGFRVKDTIYLNSALKQHPELHKAILRHEKRHTTGYAWSDVIMDVSNKELKDVKRDYYKFILKNPKSLYNFLPVIKIGKYWAIDLTLVAFYSIILAGGILLWILA